MAEILIELAAHVFQIDVKQRDKWISVSGPGAIPLEISRDSRTGKFAVVARDNQTTEVLRSPLQGDLKFTPTSAKFGQWTQNQDEGIVYGVGFQSEANLESFSKAFTQGLIKGKTPRVPDASQGAPPQGGKSDEALVQLKFENERLKIALGTSSANAKKWEQQLQTLKTNNSKLRTALQESASNVEEWKCQLTLWKDESTRFKKQCETQQQKLSELEGSSGANSFEMQQLQQELRNTKKARDDLQTKLATMQDSKSTIDDSTKAIVQIEQDLKAQLQHLSTVRNRLGQINFT